LMDVLAQSGVRALSDAWEVIGCIIGFARRSPARMMCRPFRPDTGISWRV
jgi:hypothetical protein